MRTFILYTNAIAIPHRFIDFFRRVTKVVLQSQRTIPQLWVSSFMIFGIIRSVPQWRSQATQLSHKKIVLQISKNIFDKSKFM